MTLLQLNYTIQLSHYQSFSETARKLGISQPALSLQIRKLEDEIGMSIFKRSSTKITTTAEGDIFIEKAQELLQMTENLKDLPFKLEEKPGGELRIGIIPTLAPYWMSMFLGDFASKYPKIKLTITELKTEEIIRALKNGLLDAGFFSTPVKADGMEFRPLFYERFFLYVSDKHELYQYDEIDINRVDLKEMWYLREGNCFQNQVDSVCVFAKEPGEFQNVVYLSDSIESLCRIVENAGGITFLPELATLSISPDKENLIKDIAGHPPLREISLVTTKISKNDRLIDILIEKALASIPKRMQQKPQKKTLDTNLKIK